MNSAERLPTEIAAEDYRTNLVRRTADFLTNIVRLSQRDKEATPSALLDDSPPVIEFPFDLEVLPPKREIRRTFGRN